RNAPNLHPSCQRLEASERPSRAYIHSIRRNDRGGDAGRLPEASEGDRERGTRRPYRGLVVAVLANGAQPPGAIGGQPPPDLARPRRRAGDQWPLMAARRQAVGAILERSGEGEEEAVRNLLLLEGRTAPGREHAAAGGDR